MERLANIGINERRTGQRHEETAGSTRGTVRPVGIGGQGFGGGGRDRHVAAFAELRAAHEHDGVAPVDVAPLKPQGLPDTHARHRQQTEQGGQSLRPESEGARRPGARHQRAHVFGREQVGLPSFWVVDDQAHRRDLVAAVPSCEVAGEAPDRRQAPGWVAACRVDTWGEHESQGVAHADRLSADVVEVRDEAGELASSVVQLVAKCTTQAKVIPERLLQRAHRATGQGRARPLRLA